MSHALKHCLAVALLLGLFVSLDQFSPRVALADDAQADDAAAAETGEGEAADAAKPEEVQVHLDSPRAVLKTFLQSYRDNKFARAAACLDFSKVEPAPESEAQIEYVQKLKAIIDRIAWVNYDKVTDENEGTQYLWPPDADNQPIVILRADDGSWQFSADMVADLDMLYALWKDVAEVVPWYQGMLLGTEIWKIGGLFIVLLIAWIIGRIVKSMLAGSAKSLVKRNREYTGAMFTSLSRAAVPMALVFGLSIGLEILRLNETVREISDTIVAVLLAIAVAYTLFCLVDVITVWLKNFSEKTSSKLDDMLAPMVTTTARGTIIVLTLVQIATILSDKPMTSVIAGLGVGGLAIGLAAQDMIKNFFGSLMIFSDQPFELGDRVVIGDTDGTVESVGFRSTRIRTLDGHLVTMPNGDVANSAVRNISARPNIKRSFSVTVTYDTPPDKVQRAIDILNDILCEHEGMDPEMPARVHFNDMTDIALSIQVLYWYHPADYWAYCDFSQRVNFEILQRFNAEGIEFAFPTQTLYLAGDPNRPLNLTGA